MKNALESIRVGNMEERASEIEDRNLEIKEVEK